MLCLKCRDIGHSVSSCPQDVFLTDGDGLDWFCSDQRMECRDRMLASSKSNDLCQRCASLDIVSWLESKPDFRGVEDLKAVCQARQDQGFRNLEDADTTFRALGSVQTVQFDKECKLCLCLFDITPNPRDASQYITLVRSWTGYRMNGDFIVDNNEERSSSRHLTVLLEPPGPSVEVHRTIVIKSDALVLTRQPAETSLGAVRLNQTQIDHSRVQQWLQLCMKSHQARCCRHLSEQLQSIKLVDARTRTIVPYSMETRDYITLSYVWGDVNQSFSGAGQVGTSLPTLPRTLEDAIDFTLQLGYRFIWIDSVCIDQSDLNDKHQQIGVMCEIYRGSYATIVAADGRSADSGMPRVNKSAGCSQMHAEFDDNSLLTMGPTLEHLLDCVNWNTRAWTFQEGRLSARCIFLTRYGAYFECNSMHCLEAIDDTHSFVHNLAEEIQMPMQRQLNLGITRNPATAPVSETDRALNIYALLVVQYSRRKMTDSHDALDAFSGMLQLLQEMMYNGGFIFGMPLAHLNWAMVWQAHRPDDDKNHDFPTWSWLSNMGGVWPGAPSLGSDGPIPEACAFDLTLWMFDRSYKTSLRTVFAQKYGTQEMVSPLTDDPLSTLQSLKVQGSLDISQKVRGQDDAKTLYFEGPALHFAVHKRWEEPGFDFNSKVMVKVLNEELFGWTTCDPRSMWRQAKKQRWLLLTRHIERDVIRHNMILLRRAGKYFKRADMLTLGIPIAKLSLLRGLGMHHLRGALI